ncbi:MAG: hypothetical protein WA445_17480 [Pseudolabrys sp.]|jgi:UDP-galactopyranose mutase
MPTYFIISGNGKGSRATRYTKLVDKILTHQNIDLEIGRRFSRTSLFFSRNGP